MPPGCEIGNPNSDFAYPVGCGLTVTMRNRKSEIRCALLGQRREIRKSEIRCPRSARVSCLGAGEGELKSEIRIRKARRPPSSSTPGGFRKSDFSAHRSRFPKSHIRKPKSEIGNRQNSGVRRVGFPKSQIRAAGWWGHLYSGGNRKSHFGFRKSDFRSKPGRSGRGLKPRNPRGSPP